jgi:dCTP deaminase
VVKIGILTEQQLRQRINSNNPDRIFLDPLLDDNQIGAISVDIRLGYDFLVSINTRTPYISLGGGYRNRNIASYFQPTRRDIGEGFLVYPGQLVLTTSLEYIKLPKNVYAEVITRSSYNRLGIRLSTMLQPGFRGCIPIEVVNDSNNPVEVIVGSRMFQIKLYNIEQELEYGNLEQRKYYGNVSPAPSKANEDSETTKLSGLKR